MLKHWHWCFSSLVCCPLLSSRSSLDYHFNGVEQTAEVSVYFVRAKFCVGHAREHVLLVTVDWYI